MKVAQISTSCGIGSIGKIAKEISELSKQYNIENRVYYSEAYSDYDLSYKYMNKAEIKINALKSRIFGNNGFNSTNATKRLIKKLIEFDPDIIHLHNIHGHNLNIEYFFKYIKKENKKIIWTFHDCYTFTGYCTHFQLAKCEKWKTECSKCPIYKQFSWFMDNSKVNYIKKINSLSNNEHFIITTPSNWLKNLIRESFLKNYYVEVINNGLDTNVFKPTESNIKKEMECLDKKIILGVPMGTGERKGFKYFIELSKMINNDEVIFLIVNISEKEEEKLPDNIKIIKPTWDQNRLAQIYTAADVLLNPTMEDTFSMVNLESMACGTPVVVFNTGGAVETVDGEVGIVVEQGNVESMYEKAKILMSKNLNVKCREHVLDNFDKDNKFLQYIELYKKSNMNK